MAEFEVGDTVRVSFRPSGSALGIIEAVAAEREEAWVSVEREDRLVPIIVSFDRLTKEN